MADVQKELEILREQCPTILEAIHNSSPDGEPFAGIIRDETGRPQLGWGLAIVLRGSLQFSNPDATWDHNGPREVCWLEYDEDSQIADHYGCYYLASDDELTDEAMAEVRERKHVR